MFFCCSDDSKSSLRICSISSLRWSILHQIGLVLALTVWYVPLSSLLGKLTPTELTWYSIVCILTRLEAWIEIRGATTPYII